MVCVDGDHSGTVLSYVAATHESKSATKIRSQKGTQRRFVIVGAFPGIRRALIERGWVEQEDPSSTNFDLKWALKSSDIDFDRLQPHQIVNHFPKNRHVTTKIGLSNSLRELKWIDDVDCNSFFPRCYDLNSLDQALDFTEDFMICAAIWTLRRFLNDGAGPFERVMLALLACEAWLRAKEAFTEALEESSNHSYADEGDEVEDTCSVPAWGLSISEWETLLGEKLPSLAKMAPTSGQARSWVYRCPSHGGGDDGGAGGEVCSACGLADGRLRQRVTRALATVDGEEGCGVRDGPMQRLASDVRVSNVWIVKPAGKSRGRGICVVRSLAAAAAFMTPNQPHQAERWVAQKYIERPLLIQGRKFDIRQWVLVSDWNPLTVWFYTCCYLRLAIKGYDLEALDDRTAHLCNNCIQREDPAFDQAAAADSMWDSDRFQHWLSRRPMPQRLSPSAAAAAAASAARCGGAGGAGPWEAVVRPQMEAVAVRTLRSGEGRVGARRGCCELFGFDYLVDEGLGVWLLEVNSSPDMSPSTPVTARLCEPCLRDLVPILLHAAQPPPPPPAPNDGAPPDGAPPQPAGGEEGGEAAGVAAGECGGWRRIYRGIEALVDPSAAPAAELQVRGRRAAVHQAGPAGPPLYQRLGGMEGTARQGRRLRVAGSRCEVESRTLLLRLLNTTGLPPAAPSRPAPAPRPARVKLAPQCQKELEIRMEAWARARADRLEALRAEKERQEAAALARPEPGPGAARPGSSGRARGGGGAEVAEFVRRMHRDASRRADKARDFEARVALAHRIA